MRIRRMFGAVVLSLFVVLCLGITRNIQAQSNDNSQTNKSTEDETNLDTQLYLIVGTDQAVTEPKLPASLDSVVKQLRATLPFKNYRLAATLVNRIRNDGHLNLRWLGGPFAVAASSAVTPSFSEFRVRTVRLLKTADGGTVVQLSNFNFSARIPIQTGVAVAQNGPAAPVINYENTGLETDFSMREGEPVVVGTLNIGPSGEAIILVFSAKRTQK